VIALLIPGLLLACGAVLKKVVRGDGWRRTDFFLGVELCLSALGSAMVYVNDLTLSMRVVTVSRDVGPSLTKTVTFMVITLFLLLFVLSTHQDWERRTQNLRGQVLWLGVLCNSIGVVLFSAFVLVVKGA
jgi:hypothetical protein